MNVLAYKRTTVGFGSFRAKIAKDISDVAILSSSETNASFLTEIFVACNLGDTQHGVLNSSYTSCQSLSTYSPETWKAFQRSGWTELDMMPVQAAEFGYR